MGSHRVGHDWSDLAAAAAAGVGCSRPVYDSCILIFCFFLFPFFCFFSSVFPNHSLFLSFWPSFISLLFYIFPSSLSLFSSFKDHSHFISIAKCLGGRISWNTDSILGEYIYIYEIKTIFETWSPKLLFYGLLSISSWTKFNCKRVKVTYRLVLTEVWLLICAGMWVGNGYSSQAIYFALICNNWAPQLFILSLFPANSDTYLRKLSWLTNNFGYAELLFFF